jgi:hypothetical protein
MSRDQRAAGPILGRGTKLVGSLIGAGSEAYAHHKEKSAQKAHANAQDHSDDSDVQHEYDEQLDEENWALDEASGELATDESQLGHTLLIETSGLEIPTDHLRTLPYPVILPQRRPQTKSRCFVRAYAPLLGDCKGIDEETFLKFLDEFHDKSQTSDSLQAVNVAAIVVGMVPSVIAMAVATATSAATRVAIEGQGRYRSNSYLDQINEKLFNPRNLHCVIMTFKPESSQQFIDVDMSRTNEALTKSMNHEHKLGKMKASSGTSKGEFTIPEAAPLVYPTIDKVAFATSEHLQALPAPKQNALKRSSAFLQDYLDRRAEAEYAGTHGEGSKLTVPGATDQQKFASRYSDPNHPANSGSIIALLTGGAIDPRAKILGKRADLRAKRSGQALTEQDRHNIAMGRGGPPKKHAPVRGTMRKVLSENVVYMLIAEIPSPEEIVKMTAREQQAR